MISDETLNANVAIQNAENAVQPKKKPAQPKTESAPVDVKCQYCGVDYSSKMGITNHLRQMHPEKYYANGNTKPQLSCSQCEEKYYSRNSKLICCIL